MRQKGHSAEDGRMTHRRSELPSDDELTRLIERGRDREAAELASHRFALGESSESLALGVTESGGDEPVDNAG